MARRPTVVTVMGILNIVFGSLSLLCSLCGGIMLLWMVNDTSTFRVGGINVIADMWDFMKRELPAYPLLTFGSLVEALVVNTLLVIGGIGLLNMRGWGRVLSLVYSILTILVQIGMVIFTIAFVNPTVQRWQEDFARRVGGQLPPGAMSGDSTFSNIMSIGGAFLGIAYAVVLLVIMLLPSVSAAFAGTAPSPFDRGGPDEGGDEYERQKRNPWDY